MIPFSFSQLFGFLLILLQLAAAPSFAADSPDTRALPLEAKVAFPDLEWSGWSPVSDGGKAQPLGPIVLTHAGDGSNRIFVATQRGVIHVFENRQSAKKTMVFLDLEPKVVYNDGQNEEGLLGLAFHPKYKQNGYFFVYNSTRDAQHTSEVYFVIVSANGQGLFRFERKEPSK